MPAAGATAGARPAPSGDTGGTAMTVVFDGVAGVAQPHELHSLDDAPVLDVEAGDDADLKHGPVPCPSPPG